MLQKMKTFEIFVNDQQKQAVTCYVTKMKTFEIFVNDQQTQVDISVNNLLSFMLNHNQ